VPYLMMWKTNLVLFEYTQYFYVSGECYDAARAGEYRDCCFCCCCSHQDAFVSLWGLRLKRMTRVAMCTRVLYTIRESNCIC